MTFTWGTRLFDATGSFAPELSIVAVLEEKGSLRRTCVGTARAAVVYRKWAYSFIWADAPDAILPLMEDMVASGNNVVFADASLGTYTFRLSAGDLRASDTGYGLANISATFREA